MSTLLERIDLSEKTKTAKLIEQLEKVSLNKMYQASFKALVRLHLFFTGRTHEMILEFSKQAEVSILRKAGKDQVLDGATGYQVQTHLLKMWDKLFREWQTDLEKVRVEAASIPFGVMAVMHERLVLPVVQSSIQEAVEDGVFKPQLNVLLNAAAEHLYGDTLNLSQRIWRVDRDAQNGINSILINGISNGDSAWDIAQQLEQFLGANEDCPRWTSTRLYGRTKSEIASGNTTGLLRGDQCDGRGVAYNALRLARTEIQKAHALATDRILMSQPWVEKEKIHLSAAHPEKDICDEIVEGGEKGEGIYDVGTIELPLHPNCLCFKTAVLMDQKEFTSSLRGWLDGSQPWSAMDDYAELVGGDVNKSILPNAINLAVWLFSEDLENWLQ